MYRALTVFLALFLLSVSAASVYAHVGDVTVETENYNNIPGCPETVTISRNGHTHGTGYMQLPDGRRLRVGHDRLFYSASYGAWGKGYGVSGIYSVTAQSDTQTFDFAGGRGYTGQYSGEFADHMRSRLRRYPPPTECTDWADR